MRIKKQKDSIAIIAGDSTILRELIHPDRDYKFDGRYSLAHAKLKPNTQSDKHRLKTDEVYYILKGKGELYIDNKSALVEEGDVIDIPPGAVQSIKNIGDEDLEFLCIVDPAWREEDEEIL